MPADPVPEPLPDHPTYWEGESVLARRVEVYVGERSELNENHWINVELVDDWRYAVEVTLPGGEDTPETIFYLDDDGPFGKAWMKVTVGRGIASWPHIVLNALAVRERS